MPSFDDLVKEFDNAAQEAYLASGFDGKANIDQAYAAGRLAVVELLKKETVSSNGAFLINVEAARSFHFSHHYAWEALAEYQKSL
jgi:hypothetical protein